jgi:hypothetical protein
MRKALIGILVIIGLIILLGIFVLEKKASDQQAIKAEACEYVTAYLDKTYGAEYKIIECHFQYNDEGFLGGMYIYHFLLEDEMGEQHTAEYYSYFPLTEAVDDIIFDGERNTNTTVN